MAEYIKKIIDQIQEKYTLLRENTIIWNWIINGKPVPPPHLIKQKIIKEYANNFSISIFIETGTYLGDMVNATKNTFNKIYSIELDKNLYERAKDKFKNFHHISIIQGDSGDILPRILTNITQPCLFWLDGHYSGGITSKGELDTPIIKELDCILNHHIKNHVILIDDAHCFEGKNDYPSVEELHKLVSFHKTSEFDIKDNIIRIYR